MHSLILSISLIGDLLIRLYIASSFFGFIGHNPKTQRVFRANVTLPSRRFKHHKSHDSYRSQRMIRPHPKPLAARHYVCMKRTHQSQSTSCPEWSTTVLQLTTPLYLPQSTESSHSSLNGLSAKNKGLQVHASGDDTETGSTHYSKLAWQNYRPYYVCTHFESLIRTAKIRNIQGPGDRCMLQLLLAGYWFIPYDVLAPSHE